ncbi:MAG: iron-containing redox enzyme family protein [Xanthomonadales bacterium]|nr:iron-containing redox enzyme family protein [Xanthomonadales bacterium]
MPFFDDLIAATAADRDALYGETVIRDALAGRVTRAEYIAFLTEAFHHVRQTVPLLMGCGARLPARLEWLREAVAEYIEEESGHGTPRPATELMVAYAWDTVQRGNPVGFFGMVLVLEGTSKALALSAADRLQQSLGLPDLSLRYLRSHGLLDQEHVGLYEVLMNRLDDTADRAAVLHAAKMFYRLYAAVFTGLRAAPKDARPQLAEAA